MCKKCQFIAPEVVGFNQGLRHAAPTDAVLAYDFGEGFKKGFTEEKSENPQDAISAVKKIIPQTVKGYQENGVLGALDNFADAAVEMIPGHKVVSRQWPKDKPKTLFRLPEPKNDSTEPFACGLRRRKPYRYDEASSQTSYRCKNS